MRRLILALLFVSPALGAVQDQGKKPEDKKTEAEEKSPPQDPPAQSSLVDLARKTRQESQEAKAGQAVAVYTNATLKQPDRSKVGTMVAPPPPSAESGGESGPAAQGEEALTPEEEIDAVAEEITAKRIEYVTAVNAFQVLQLSMNDLRDRYLQEADVSAQEKFQADLVQTMENMMASEQAISSLKAELTELRARARSLGMEPARLRRLIGRLPEPRRIVQNPQDDTDS
ncbi:MAG: hypothetical protein V3T83_12360 [Acidobacteriota bacterium]